jgi:DNA-binding NtrC family response regulator
VKPFDPEELPIRLRRLFSESALAIQAEAGRRALASGEAESGWIGDSEKMRDVRSLVEKVAPTPSTVLITGESGTHKKVVARLLRALSASPRGPFVAINIGGTADTLLDAQLQLGTVENLLASLRRSDRHLGSE